MDKDIVCEKLLKIYECAKADIDRWYRKVCLDKEEYKKEDAIGCIGCIGTAYILAQILIKDFHINVKEECINMERLIDYLKFDILEINSAEI